MRVFGWHVALLSQSIQDAQHSPLGEIGPARGGYHQVNHLRHPDGKLQRTGDDYCATKRRRVHNIGNGPSRSPG